MNGCKTLHVLPNNGDGDAVVYSREKPHTLEVALIQKICFYTAQKA